MKITLEPYSGGKFVAENDAEHVSTVIHQFKGLLVATGYHPETVDRYFNTDEEWFPGDDKPKSLYIQDAENYLSAEGFHKEEK